MFVERFISVVDSHTGGDPTRIMVGGLPFIKGKTMIEKAEYFEKNFDNIRKMLLREPRGHRDMFGAALVEPVTENADLGIIFMSTGNYPHAYHHMCGHGTIGVITAAVELGLVKKTEPITKVTVDVPDGTIDCYATVENGKVMSVRFDSPPVFMFKSNIAIDVPDMGQKHVDILYSGGFFLLAQARDFDLTIEPVNARKFMELGILLRKEANKQLEFNCSAQPLSKMVVAVQFSDEQCLEKGCCHDKNVVLYGTDQIARSSCGTGTSAKVALLHHYGLIEKGQEFTTQSITGTKFVGTVKETFEKDGYTQMITTVSGSARITGFNQILATEGDEFAEGLVLG